MTEIDHTLSQLRHAIAQTSDPKHRRIAEAMMLLLTAAAEQGADIARLVKRTGLPLDFVEGEGVHRFRTTNSYFIEHLGGVSAVKARLKSQFQFVELISTCPFLIGNNAGESGFDETAGDEIATKIKTIAHQYPNCDPLPQSWSECEHGKDIAQSVFEAFARSSDALNDEFLRDLLQIRTEVRDIDGVIAIIHHSGRLLARVVLQGALKSGLILHDGGVPADESYISILPAPDSGSSHWVAIPPDSLSIPLMPPGVTQPLSYLVLVNDGQLALALAGRRHLGRIGWSGNGDLIDRVSHLVTDVGVLRRHKHSLGGA